MLRPLREAMQPLLRQQQLAAQRIAEQLRPAMPQLDALRGLWQGLLREMRGRFPQNWLDLAPERSTLAPEHRGLCAILLPIQALNPVSGTVPVIALTKRRG
jgi:hypothetical protein